MYYFNENYQKKNYLIGQLLHLNCLTSADGRQLYELSTPELESIYFEQKLKEFQN